MAERRRFHPTVASDLLEACGYYDDVSTELGNRFRDAIRDRFEAITEFPESNACIHNQQRAAIVRRFPYVIIYELRNDVVGILGIFHAAFDPSNWFDRSL